MWIFAMEILRREEEEALEAAGFSYGFARMSMFVAAVCCGCLAS